MCLQLDLTGTGNGSIVFVSFRLPSSRIGWVEYIGLYLSIKERLLERDRTRTERESVRESPVNTHDIANFSMKRLLFDV